MVSSTITLDKKSSSSSSSTATASASAQASAEQNTNNSIISIPLNATASTNCSDSSSSAASSSALGLSEQKISILFPKCKPRVAEHHYQSSVSSGILMNNNNIINSSNNKTSMSTITSNSKSDITGTSSSLTTPTSLTSSSYALNSSSYGMENSGYRGNSTGISGPGSGYDLLGSRQELSSRLNNNQYESSRSSSRHASSVDKYSFYYNSQPPPLSTSPTENNANAGGNSNHFLPSDDEEDETDMQKDSYPRHSYYTSRQSHYYNLPKQDPGTPSSNSRYHWDLSSSSALSYSTPISSTVTSTIGGGSGGKRASIKSSYTKVLQSPLEDESDIEDKLKYFNYQNEMHNSTTTGVVNMPVSGSAAIEKPSGIYSNYKTNEMIVFNDIDEERRRVQQQHQAQRQENDHKHGSSTGAAGLHVSAATADGLDDGISLHRRTQSLRQDNSGGIGGGGGSGGSGGGGGGVGDEGNNSNETSSAHKTTSAATAAVSNSGSNIMEYEGSPRRFGLSLNEDSASYYMSSNYKLNLTSPSLLTPPRPGFPQRVIPSQHQQQQQSANNSNTSAATTPTPIGTGSASMGHHHPYHPTRSPTLLEQVSSGLNSSVTFDANALLSEFDAKRAAVSASTISIGSNSVPGPAATMESSPLEVNKLNVIRLDSDYRSEDLEEMPTKRSTPEIKPSLGLISTTADDNPTFGAGSFTTPITASSTFDYLYEFSETRKVLEEFFKCPTTEDVEKAFEKFSDYNESGDDVESLDIHYEYPAELDSKALETTYIGSSIGAEQQKSMTTLTSSAGIRQQHLQQDIGMAIGTRKSPINNNNNNSDAEVEVDDDDVGNGEALEDGDDDGEEDEEDDDVEGGVGSNLKYMINVKSKPRIKNGYTSFRKKKQEKKLVGMGSNALSGIVTVSGGNEDDNDGEDEEEIDIYSANHHHHHSFHIHQQQQRLQQQQQSQEQLQQHQNLSNVRQHVIMQQQQQQQQQYQEHERHFSLYLDPGSRASSCDVINESNLDSTQFMTNGNGKKLRSNGGGSGNGKKPLARRQSKNFNYSPDTTDYESNCGDYDSEISLKYGSEYGGGIMVNGGSEMMCDDLNNGVISSASTGNNSCSTMIDNGVNNVTGTVGSTGNYARYYTSMPVLEDGLSSGHVSDTENNNPGILPTPDLINSSHKLQQASNSYNLLTSPTSHTMKPSMNSSPVIGNHNNNMDGLYGSNGFRMNGTTGGLNSSTLQNNKIFKNRDPELESLYTINTIQSTPPPPAPAPHRKSSIDCDAQTTLQQLHNQQQASSDVQAALKDIRTCLQRNKTLSSPTHPQSQCPSVQQLQQPLQQSTMKTYEKHSLLTADKLESPVPSISPVWIPRSRESKLVAISPTTVNNSSSGLLLPTTPTTGGPTERSTNLSGEKDSLLHGNNAKNLSALDDDEDPDTDLETDRLLGHQRLDDQGFYDDNSKSWTDRKTRSLLHKLSPKQQTGSVGANNGTSLYGSKPNNQGSLLRQGLSTLLSPASAITVAQPASSLPEIVTSSKASPGILNSSIQNQNISSLNNNSMNSANLINLNGPNETSAISPDHSHQTSPIKIENKTIESASPNGSNDSKSDTDKKKKNKNKEVLIEGVLFRARYLGSTQLVCEGQPTKSTRMMQAEEAVSRIKSPDGEPQPSTEVDLFISTEKIMVLNTDLKEIMMDHALRTISYIADIGDLVVLMARRRFVPQDVDSGDSGGGGNATGAANQSGQIQSGSTPPQKSAAGPKGNRTPKMICHVFESEEAQFIAQSIGQAFQVAYMEFLKANGIEDHSFMKEMDYQEVLNSQEIFGDELEIFAKKELQKEVVVPKAKGEILGVVIVESGWGSMLPTVVIANLASSGAAARCGQLNIGDQIIAINGLSLVGLPLSTCQSYIKNTKNQTVVKFTVVPCAPVVEVKIKRPNTKYQLGFSVQNGVICSLLRGGIAERGGVRVGHRIIEINNQSVVAVPHEKIVNLLATSVGEILMKTMPTSMFRLLTGQENPVYI
ncbi:serine-rich adhesin for platelets-like [Armigeres subalbatus]|uniref:serine-rich adhesin for platelets-like n=1 Tax=Armigeres subalbatus TaxID=124917 RepID=UPI002ED24530